jgi:hypothetical protein
MFTVMIESGTPLQEVAKVELSDLGPPEVRTRMAHASVRTV